MHSYLNPQAYVLTSNSWLNLTHRIIFVKSNLQSPPSSQLILDVVKIDYTYCGSQCNTVFLRELALKFEFQRVSRSQNMRIRLNFWPIKRKSCSKTHKKHSKNIDEASTNQRTQSIMLQVLRTNTTCQIRILWRTHAWHHACKQRDKVLLSPLTDTSLFISTLN